MGAPGERARVGEMLPAMTVGERDLFLSFVKRSERYLEFGAGGSTVSASSHVKSWIISIDSSKEWLDKVSTACAAGRTRPEFIFVDIGPISNWGYPVDPGTKPLWPEYHSGVWNRTRSFDADLYLVDGRFRVACFAQTVLHCRTTAIIGFHDFASRTHYHCVREISREIAAAENMSFFLPLSHAVGPANNILDEYRFDPR